MNKNEIFSLLKSGKDFSLPIFDTYRDDPDIVLEAIKYDPYSILDAANEIKNNISIIKIALKSSPYILNYLNDELKNNIELVKISVLQDPSCIIYAGKIPRNTPEIILLVTEKHEKYFFFASDEIKTFCNTMNPITGLKKLIFYQNLNENCPININEENLSKI